MRYLPGSPAVVTGRIAPKICQGQPPTGFLQISSKSVHFGRVIAERVNTAKTRRKVNQYSAEAYSFEPNSYFGLSCLDLLRPVLLVLAVGL